MGVVLEADEPLLLENYVDSELRNTGPQKFLSLCIYDRPTSTLSPRPAQRATAGTTGAVSTTLCQQR